MNISSNIAAFIQYKGISIRSFEQQIGCSNGVISRCISKGTDISSQWVSKIISEYPELNITWLLTGNGEMLKPSAQTQPTAPRHDSMPTRPRIPFAAQAGILNEMSETAYNESLERLPVIPTFPYYDFTIPIEGDSMSPEYLPGDELACVKLASINEVRWGRAHVLDTARGVVLKQIFDGGDRILCHSVNPQYPDFMIDKSDVYNICDIVGYTRNT